MAKRSSILERLKLLEKEHRFLTWVLAHRFLDSLTDDELEAYARENRLPDPAPNRPSRLEGLDRKSLLKLWEESERLLEYRSSEDLKQFCTHGHWPEQLSRLKYSHKDGAVVVKWQIEKEVDKLETKLHGGNE